MCLTKLQSDVTPEALVALPKLSSSPPSAVGVSSDFRLALETTYSQTQYVSTSLAWQHTHREISKEYLFLAVFQSGGRRRCFPKWDSGRRRIWSTPDLPHTRTSLDYSVYFQSPTKISFFLLPLIQRVSQPMAGASKMKQSKKVILLLFSFNGSSDGWKQALAPSSKSKSLPGAESTDGKEKKRKKSKTVSARIAK